MRISTLILNGNSVGAFKSLFWDQEEFEGKELNDFPQCLLADVIGSRIISCWCIILFIENLLDNH
jgi:hypothetical protein